VALISVYLFFSQILVRTARLVTTHIEGASGSCSLFVTPPLSLVLITLTDEWPG